MYKIAVMGRRGQRPGLSGPGTGGLPRRWPGGGHLACTAMAKENYAIIYMTEQLAAKMGPDIARYKDALTPAIILIPGKEGSLGIGMANVKTAVERAVGADIS